MSGDPAVSVVVATRNRADRLRRLLDGLAAQDLGAPFEVAVVDDGSTGDTPAALATEDRFALRTLRRDDPGGPAAARNDGWRSARAPLIALPTARRSSSTPTRRISSRATPTRTPTCSSATARTTRRRARA